MEIIKYNYNWNNKLSSPSHTTLRLRNDSKYQRGKSYEEILKEGKIETSFGVSQIEAIKHLRLNDINEFIARIDTGYGRDECINLIKTMYKNYPIDWDTKQLSLILLVRI